MDDAAETFRIEEPQPLLAWSSAVVWSIFVAIAWLAFELTAQPAVAAVVVCLKFGWNDLLTGIWLRRRDPSRGRGRACSWFCFASAVMKAALTAFGLLLLIIVAEFKLKGVNAGNEVPQAFPGVMLIMAIGMPLEALLASCGCLSARRAKGRVWIDNGMHQSRRQNAWPPRTTYNQANNNNLAAWACVTMFSTLVVLALAAAIGIGWAMSAAIGLLICPAAVVGIFMLARGGDRHSPGGMLGWIDGPARTDLSFVPRTQVMPLISLSCQPPANPVESK